MSDQTHLTNFSGNKKACPVYLTLGNLPCTWCNSPASMPVLPVALLPILPRISKSSKPDQHQRQINHDTLRDVYKFVLSPRQDQVRDGVPCDCTEGKVRTCFPILAGCIADHMENVALHGLKSNICPACQVPMGELGSNIKVYPSQD